MMVLVKMKMIDENSKIPVMATQGAACYDAFARYIKVIDPNKVEVGLGFMTEIPHGYKGIIAPRSGIAKTEWVLANSFGIIDSDFRGEWRAIFTCVERNTVTMFPFQVGDRVAQIYFEEVMDVRFKITTDELSSTDRGTEGFGTTGK